MTRTSDLRVHLIDQMNAEWRSVGRSPAAVASLRAAAGRDATLGRLVVGSGGGPPPCPTPFDMVEHLRHASGRASRDEAARVFGLLLRQSAGDEMMGRLLVQLLLPGLVSVARRLQWGRGGAWRDREEFFGELVTTSWLVVTEWGGQDRAYAVLDLLSAIRCRMRRQLLHATEKGKEMEALRLLANGMDEQAAGRESALERLSRLLLDLHHGGLGRAETQELYARVVLGYSLGEIAAITGKPGRAVGRSEATRRSLCLGTA
jgi:hypothetical protein